MHRTTTYALFAAGLCLAAVPVFADTFPVILRGKVTLPDGSPPPVTMGLERICSDNSGSAPGPLTTKKGEYVWRMDIDAFDSRVCFIRATSAGYVSSRIDIPLIQAAANPNMTLATLIVTPQSADPDTINSNESQVPGKALGPWKAAMKSMDAGNIPEVAQHLRDAVQAVPKFAQGWHTLGVALSKMQMPAESRDAFEHAVAADPKYFSAYASLARQCIRMGVWDCAAKAADSEIKIDTKHVYLETYLHLADADYHKKDFDGALAAVKEAETLDKSHAMARTEYIWGRILEAKGDMEGARQHITHYLQVDAAPPDMADVKTHLDNLGKPGENDPKLEVF